MVYAEYAQRPSGRGCRWLCARACVIGWMELCHRMACPSARAALDAVHAGGAAAAGQEARHVEGGERGGEGGAPC
eukprot:1753001-Prymnesium_polylepis.1